MTVRPPTTAKATNKCSTYRGIRRRRTPPESFAAINSVYDLLFILRQARRKRPIRGNRSDHPAARRSLRGPATEALGRKLANCMDLLPIRQPICSKYRRHTLLVTSPPSPL